MCFSSTFLQEMPAIALERDSCVGTLGLAGRVETFSPSKSGEVTSKEACLDGTTLGALIALFVMMTGIGMGESNASFVDRDGADQIVPSVFDVPVCSAANVGIGTSGGGAAMGEVTTVDGASDEFKPSVRGSVGPTASVAFAASAALLSNSSIRRWTMAGISFTYVPMRRWLERISLPAQLSTQCI